MGLEEWFRVFYPTENSQLTVLTPVVGLSILKLSTHKFEALKAPSPKKAVGTQAPKPSNCNIPTHCRQAETQSVHQAHLSQRKSPERPSIIHVSWKV